MATFAEQRGTLASIGRQADHVGNVQQTHGKEVEFITCPQ
jgi:hypothetical protein